MNSKLFDLITEPKPHVKLNINYRYSTLFSPPLPKEKTNAINKISFGVAEKVILSFDEEWLPNGRSYNFLWRNEERAKLKIEDYWTATIGECTTPVGSRRVITCQTRGYVSKLVSFCDNSSFYFIFNL